MRSIKALPEAVRNTVRSGIILFDLTRVVEELIFNSLDATATKVLVFVGVGTCYVKVVDDGYGISRDGLELLGERYATSKLYHLADMDAASGTFGYRGESLASISDVSLLEIVTRAYGRPNGYRKVMKGSKCLYLGIDDDRKDVGTTVVVRDLFYNQPVRRKYMQSSAKKVLHTVKKCVLRIALVHSKVSFKVVDVESEDKILCTRPSSSPLSQLMSGFGIEDSSSLHELNASDGELKLSGYISGPCDSFVVKAFQYVYINSRFICKGPIHKLLNHLAARFECLDPWKPNNVSQKGKRSRSQAYPAYMLNLSCPQSLYDLTFEPSKTYAEFKDWEAILTFIEKAIQHLWRENITNGECYSGVADILGKDEMWKEADNVVSVKEDLFDAVLPEDFEFAIKRCRIHSHQDCLHLPSSPLEMLTKEGDHLFHREHERIPFLEFLKNTTECKEKQTEMEFVHQTEYSFQSWDGSLAKCKPPVTQKSDNYPWTSDNNFLLADSYFLENRATPAERSNIHVLQLGNESPRVEPGGSNGLAGNALSVDCFEFSNGLEVCKDIKIPFLQSCSSRESLPLDGALFASEKGFELSINGCRTKRKRLRPDERVHILEADVGSRCIDFFPRTMWQDEESSVQRFSRFMTKDDMSKGSDLLSRTSVKSFTSHREPFAEDNDFLSDSAGQMVDSGHHSLESEWCSLTSDPLFQAPSWDVENFTKNDALEGSSRSRKRANYGHFADTEEKGYKFSCDIISKCSRKENCTSSCTSSGLDFKDYTDSTKDFFKSLKGNNLHNIFSPEHPDRLIDDTHWLYSDSCGADYTNIDVHESQRDWFRHHVLKERSRRSHSAPPFYKQRRKFISLNHYSTIKAGNPNAHTFYDPFPSPDAGEFNNLQSSGVCHRYLEPSFAKDLMFDARPDTKNETDTMTDMKEIQKGEKLEQPKFSQAHNKIPVEDFISRDIHDSINSGTKWRNSCPETANHNRSGNRSGDIHDQNNILDISSGFLHLAGDSLVPESINKNFFEDAKVLQQMDKKFIPVVAGGTLAVIDQHAADERIRLEELRQKVLSGEAKTVTYLDTEQELILPEIGYQLLHNYAEQIKDWGWICNIHSQGSRSFKKSLNLLHRRPTVVTLLAVPCILGVNLSDIDLQEFLQQLSDTDGSSTMPQSVLRILNFKACRGAIMFGDSLLHSECSLIVEELKQTSLCFQCAHGRPTTVPLVNLEALHKQIAKLGVLGDGSSELWHGLHRHEPSLERAAQRLSASGG